MESNKYFSWTNLLILIYAATVLWVGLVYVEPWRDLAHAWVTVRDGSLIDIFTTIPAHSHPFLWFLLLKPLVWFGLPYQSSIILNILFCILSVYLIVSKSPLPWWIKILFVFSFPMIYEFAFPGRIYALGVFLSFYLCSAFEGRHRHPILFSIIIALLFHTHSLFLSISATVALLFFVEAIRTQTLFQRKYIIGFSLILLSGLYLIWYVLEVNQYTSLLGRTKNANTFFEYLSLGLLAEKSQFFVLAAFTLALFMVSRLGKSFEILFLTFSAISFLIYCYSYITPQQIRYYQILLICILAWWWLAEKYQPVTTLAKQRRQKSKIKPKIPEPVKPIRFPGWNKLFLISLGICLIFSSFHGIKSVANEIKLPHSDAKNAVDFLRKNNLLDYHLVGHRSYTASSLVPYLPKNKTMWYPDREEAGTYLKFDSLYYVKNLSVTYAQALAKAEKHFNSEKNVLIIFSVRMAEEFTNRWQLIYQTTKAPIQTDEAYFIYARKN